MLNMLSGPAMDYSGNAAIQHLISAAAREYPDHIAIKFYDETLTYHQLEDTSNRLATLLISKNLGKGEIAALAVNRSAEMVVTLLAILKTGAGYLPIDPEFPVERVKYMLDDAGVKMLICQAAYAEHFITNAEQLVLEDAIDALSAVSAAPPEVVVEGEDTAYVLYTSGTTGNPKGVPVTHSNMVNFLLGMQQQPGISANDKLLAVTTVSFDIAGLELFLPLTAGACTVIADANTARDGRAIMHLIHTEAISIMQATPYTWKMMMEGGWTDKLTMKVLCGGEALAKDLALKLLNRCSELWNMYGPTETTIWSTLKRLNAYDDIITIGTPITNTQIYLLNSDSTAIPAGEVGEIMIGGAGVAKGYLHLPELTNERFVANPFGQGRLYRTGDLGRILPNGEIQCLGRTDHQIKIRGYRLEPEGIAQHIKRLPNVKDVVVTARNDLAGNMQLVAYVIVKEPLTESLAVQVKMWRDTLRGIIQEYMVPRYIAIVPDFPLTLNGKIDIKALPDPDYGLNSAAYAAPRTTIEKLVAEIWQKHLMLEKVGIYDDFFELGGHSLVAVEIMTELERQTGKALPLATLFNHSTVEQLALLLRLDGRSVTWDSLVPIKPFGTKTPLYIVHGAGLNVLLFNTLAKNMDPDQPVYGLQARGMNGVDEPLNRMEDIAAHYISEILKQNPEGPYALAGYSFGGIIAYEMAIQMDKMGKKVTMLAMFDTYAYRSDKFDALPKRLLKRSWFLTRQIAYSFVLLARNPKDTISYKSEMIRRRLVRRYWALRYGKDQKQEGFFGYSNKIDLMNEEAERNYKLQPYPLAVELFRAKKITFYMEDFEYLGWKPYALNGVNIHDIPGEHNLIFAPPNDIEFAAILQDCLDKAGA